MLLEECSVVMVNNTTTIDSFDCGNDKLNNFLLNEAINYHREYLAETYLIVHNTTNVVVAYYSLLNDRIGLNDGDKKIWNRINRKISNNKRKSYYPAVKIGRLAVNKAYAGNGFGGVIIDFLKYSFARGNRSGCRFITVDALRSAVGFYSSKECGFDLFTETDKDEPTRLMVYDIMRYADEHKISRE